MLEGDHAQQIETHQLCTGIRYSTKYYTHLGQRELTYTHDTNVVLLEHTQGMLLELCFHLNRHPLILDTAIHLPQETALLVHGYVTLLA